MKEPEYVKVRRDGHIFYFAKVTYENALLDDEALFENWLRFADFVINEETGHFVKNRIPLQAVMWHAFGA
jgi:hypothetical protein